MSPRLAFEPLTGRIGARVVGADSGDSMDDAAIAQLREALLAYKVLLLPDQDLSPAAHIALGRRFGELVTHPDYPTIDGYDEIMVIENGPLRPPDNDYWHKDMTFRPNPPHCSLLHARELPPGGGDTMFADMEAVLEDLSPPLRSLLDNLTVVHDQLHGFEPTLLANNEFERLEKIRAHPPEMRRNTHPAVGTHPLTGRSYLGVDDCFATHFVELAAAESDMLLKLLREQLKLPRYHLRIHWAVDDLVIWDNVSTLHYAVGDYDAYRKMHRVTVSRYCAS